MSTLIENPDDIAGNTVRHLEQFEYDADNTIRLLNERARERFGCSFNELEFFKQSSVSKIVISEAERVAKQDPVTNDLHGTQNTPETEAAILQHEETMWAFSKAPTRLEQINKGEELIRASKRANFYLLADLHNGTPLDIDEFQKYISVLRSAVFALKINQHRIQRPDLLESARNHLNAAEALMKGVLENIHRI